MTSLKDVTKIESLLHQALVHAKLACDGNEVGTLDYLQCKRLYIDIVLCINDINPSFDVNKAINKSAGHPNAFCAWLSNQYA